MSTAANPGWREWEGQWYQQQPDGQWVINPTGPPPPVGWREWEGQWYQQQPDGQWVINPTGPAAAPSSQTLPPHVDLQYGAGNPTHAVDLPDFGPPSAPGKGSKRKKKTSLSVTNPGFTLNSTVRILGWIAIVILVIIIVFVVVYLSTHTLHKTPVRRVPVATFQHPSLAAPPYNQPRTIYAGWDTLSA